MLANKIKLVIWDLDDTFWDGTLAEGAISPIEANKDIVITLARRGIISSVCSKNNFDTATVKLMELGVMDYFVLPRIAFAAKGQMVAAIIEEAGLRPENVLFIDDNLINREEARHVSLGLMTADPRDILPVLLDLPEAAGKDDAGLSRLQQYKLIEQKVLERAGSNLGNEEFLRHCDIRVEIDNKIEPEFDRIVELANRTNQLNFTKIRLETPDAIAQFRELLGRYGITPGVVRVSDRYGDYGIVGYFVAQRTASRNELKHFVFSCRTMNMGIEQYVYERLQKPSIQVKGPVANEISPFAVVDWISDGYRDQGLNSFASSKKLTLLGGCELLQLASLCSSNRREFVNTYRNEIAVRFDDPGFVLGDRDKIVEDADLAKLGYWTHDDAVAFDRSIAESEIVISAMYASIGTNLYATPAGLMLRPSRNALRAWRDQDERWFTENLTLLGLDRVERYGLLSDAMDRMGRLMPEDGLHFALGVNTKQMTHSESLLQQGWPQCLENGQGLAVWLDAAKATEAGARATALRHVYNRFLRDYCEKNRKFIFVDVDTLIRPADMFEPIEQAGDSETEMAPQTNAKAAAHQAARAAIRSERMQAKAEKNAKGEKRSAEDRKAKEQVDVEARRAARAAAKDEKILAREARKAEKLGAKKNKNPKNGKGPQKLLPDHFKYSGYIAIADHILQQIAKAEPAAVPEIEAIPTVAPAAARSRKKGPVVPEAAA